MCFNAPIVETYREPDRRRHPGRGRLGPDLCKTTTDLGDVVDLLLAYPEPEARLRDVMLDQRVMCGVGNVYRCEVLWATELSPWAHVGDLTHHDAVVLVNTAADDAAGRARARVGGSRTPTFEAGSPCTDATVRGACGATRRSPSGASASTPGLLYWCEGCQVRLDPTARRRLARDGPAPGGGEVPLRPALAP